MNTKQLFSIRIRLPASGILNFGVDFWIRTAYTMNEASALQVVGELDPKSLRKRVASFFIKIQ